MAALSCLEIKDAPLLLQKRRKRVEWSFKYNIQDQTEQLHQHPSEACGMELQIQYSRSTEKLHQHPSEDKSIPRTISQKAGHKEARGLSKPCFGHIQDRSHNRPGIVASSPEGHQLQTVYLYYHMQEASKRGKANSFPQRKSLNDQGISRHP
ncbi:uncharacterized protein [Triticum aestivum]|uniref:uncharacterized protein n=1 Tax=Triticum aestivum TaxID=4565 RepID=UPI001D0218AF|nr:uncharacterized protein LOC123053578 [Triticum aestivum]